MSVQEALRSVREHWFVFLLLSASGLLAAWFYSWTQTPIYSAHIQVFVSTSGNGIDLSQLNQGSSFTVERVKSYAEIVNSPVVTQLVIEQLNLSDTPEKLGRLIVASSPLDTVLLDITVNDADPQRAVAIANSIADQFPLVVDRLEAPRDGGISPVKVSVTKRAILPTNPTSPRTKTNLLLGLVVGTTLGLGSAALRTRLDRRIHSKEYAATVASAPILGALVSDSHLTERSVVIDGLSHNWAEGIRQLRTSIRFLSVDRRLSSFVVTSSVPAEGKTVVTANLAVAVAQAGDSVVLIDGDLRRPRLADVFALPDGVGLTSVLLGDSTVAHALHQWRDDLPLYILTAGPKPPNPSELLGSEHFTELIEGLVKSDFTVIFDAPPLLPVTDASLIASVTEGALVVTHIGKTRTDQLSEAVEILRNAGANVLGIVANRLRKADRGYYYDDGHGRGGSRRAPIASHSTPRVMQQRRTKK